MDPYVMIMMTLGYLILLLVAIIIVTFLAWVVKIEFEWFFGISIFKSIGNKAREFGNFIVVKLFKLRKEVKKANNSRTILNEDA